MKYFALTELYLLLAQVIYGKPLFIHLVICNCYRHYYNDNHYYGVAPSIYPNPPLY